MNLELLKPTDELIREIAETLRPIDRLEVSLLTDAGPAYPALLDAVVHSGDDCWVVTEDDIPLCVFGVAGHPDHKECGVPWMMATPLMNEHKSHLVREARKVIEGFHCKYPVLANIVYQHNRPSIAFLKQLGFSFVSRVHVGALNAPFLTFVKNV